jgi:TolB-like protein
LVLALIAVVVSLGSSVRAEYKKTKVAVIDFQLHGAGYETADMGKIVAEWLITALVRDGRFEVIERRLLEKILTEQQLGLSGILDESSASKLGQMLGAKVVISGSVMSLQGQIEVNARIIDVQTGSVIAAENVKSRSTEGLEDMVFQMAQAIIKDFPLEGYVVRRSGRDVIIDLGKTSGIRPGMRFLVFKEGEVIKHPKTGEVLDVLLKETGRVEVVHVMDKTADAVVISESGAVPIDYGQMVKSATLGEPSQPQSPLPQHLRQAPPPTQQPAKPEKAAKPDRAAKPAKEAKPARTAKPSPPPPQTDGDLARRLAALEARVPELRALWLDRDRNQEAWRDVFKQMRDEEVKIYREDRRNPQVFVLLARMYHAIEDSRSALGYTQDAIRLNEKQPSLWMLRGDVILETITRLEPAKRTNHKLAPDAVKAYQAALANTDDPVRKAFCANLIGEIYADILMDEKSARKFWGQAVEIAPGSEGAQRAASRLK